MTDDPRALRLDAFRLARHRGRSRDLAWAAARLRIVGIALDPAERRAARAAQGRLGRALRLARARPAPVATGAGLQRPPEVRSGAWRAIGLAGASAAVLIALALLRPGAPASEGARDGAPAFAAAVPTAPPLRGRSEPGVSVPVALTEPSPLPTEAASPSAPAAAPEGAAVPPGGGPEGVPGGSGSGSSGAGFGTPAPSRPPVRPTPTSAPTPAPTPTPVATPDPTPPPVSPPNVMHVRGQVVDARSGRGMPNVCVAIGVSTCAGAPVTDAQGFFAVDLTIGRALAWQLTFIAPGYTSQQVRISSRPGTFSLAPTRLLPAR